MPTPFKITLRETRVGCAICETTPRYDVLVNNIKVDQLYFNTRGYIGYLPTPDGKKLDIGERSISAFRREVAKINREAKQIWELIHPITKQWLGAPSPNP
jgi:hypothetical protein